MKNINLKLLAMTLIILSWTLGLQAQSTCPDKSETKISNPGQVTITEPNTTTPGTGLEGQASAMSEERMIYWVHGMSGNEGSWSTALSYTQNNGILPSLPFVPGFPARKAYCEGISYEHNESNSLNAATTVQNNLVSDQALGSQYDQLRSILIAHSQGGIVSRYLDGIFMAEPHNRKVGGMAFFGTPHLGAKGLESGQERARIFMSQSALDLAAYQITSLTSGNDNIVVRKLATLFNLESWLQAGVETISSDIGSLLFNANASPMAGELVEGSETINGLNNLTTDIPMIPYYGVFNDYTTTINGAPLQVETVWSTLQYLFDTPNNQAPFLATDFEYELQQTMNGVRSRYIASAVSEQAAADEFISSDNINNCLNTGNFAGIFFTPYFGSFIGATCVNNLMSSNAAAIQRRDAALRGARWFDTVNDQYKVLIDARVAEPVSGVVTKCICDAPTWLEPVITIVDPSTQTCPNDYNDFNVICDLVQEVEVIGHEWVEYPSDGLVLASSASGLPTHLIAEGQTPRPMEGSSHFGMRNDNNLKNELKLLFDGEVDRFFKTDPK